MYSSPNMMKKKYLDFGSHVLPLACTMAYTENCPLVAMKDWAECSMH